MGAVFDKITAAATRVITRKGAGAGASSGGWQVQAWDCFETIPEVNAFGGWVSNACTGARLVAGKRGPDGTFIEAPAGSRAAELVASIAGGLDGQSELLGGAGTQLAIAGETWLVILPDPQADSFADDRWLALSSEEVKPSRGKLKLTVDGEEIEVAEPAPGDTSLSDNDPVAIRVWDPSPRKHWDATSPVRASLVILEELRLLNAAVAAIARSRITGRGVLMVPAGTRFPAAPGSEQAEDSLLDIFIEVASTAIREPESAAATVPIVLEVPGDLINGVKWLNFGSDFDAMAIQLRDEAIRRFAAGADIPAEILLGMGDVNHWGQWAITAEALKMGAEPRLGLVCNALTSEWLRPLLESEGDADAAEAMVWYDTSALRSSSNKGASALEAFKQGLISADAARRELGFTKNDAPDTAAPAGLATPPTTEGNDLTVNETEGAPATEDSLSLAASDVTEIRLKPSEGDQAAALTAAVDGMVWSAMVAAGSRIMRTPICPRPNRGSARELASSAAVHTRHPVPGDGDVDAYRLLDGAWTRAGEVAGRYGVDPLALTAAMEGYARDLLTTGEPHTYDNVVRMLAQSGIIPSTLIGMVAR